jgi:hypothetical protein
VDFIPKLVRQRISLHTNKRNNTRRRNNKDQLYASNFIKHTQRELKSQIDPNTVVMGSVNAHLSTIDRSSRQKINKEILDLNDTIDLIELTDVCRVFHPARA